jgi:hypothetical protein
VTGWLTCHPKTLTEDEALRLKVILEQCPQLRAAAGHVRAFGEMLTQLSGQDLPGWITAVGADDLPGLSAFAAGLEGDLAAVTCGLTTRVELRADRGPSEPYQNGETADVRPRRPAAPPQTHPPHHRGTKMT